MGTLVALLLAGIAVLTLAVGRVLRLGSVRSLRGPLVFLVLSALAQWVVSVAGGSAELVAWAAAAVLLAIGFLVARVVLLFVFDWLLVRRVGISLPRLAQDVVALIVYLMVTAAVLKAALSLDVATLLVSSAVITVVIGLAFQETLGTLLAGLALAWERRLENGAWVEIDGTVGRVEELGWRSLLLRNRLGERVMVPNSEIARARVRLLGRGQAPIAVPVRLGVAYASPPHKVKELLRRVAEGIPGVVSDPPAQILTAEFADSAVVYECRLWTDEPWRIADLTDEMLTRAWVALGREGMEIPFPQRTVHMAAPRVERDVAALSRAALERCELFAGLPEQAVQALAGPSEYLSFAPGEAIVREGEASKALYVVAEGRAEVVRRGRRVGFVERADVFGEIAFLMGVPRAATVRAQTPIEVVEVDADAMRALLGEQGQLAEELAQRVAARRREMAERDDAEAATTTKRGFVGELRARLLRLVSG
jgi:small-conductance mechanosensitive channel/CRP-like cAMP-binding protein